MNILKYLLLLAAAFLAVPAVAQIPGGGGVVVGAPITGTCPNGQVIYSNNQKVGCEAGGGGGGVTEVDTNNGITGGPITTTGTVGLAAIISNATLGNATAGSAVPSANAIPVCTNNQALTWVANSGWSCTSIPLVTATSPKRVLLMGDSITANNVQYSTAAWPNGTSAYDQAGYFVWAQRLLGYQISFDPSLDKGISGNTTTQMLARYNTDVAANYASFDIMVLLGGTNDIDLSTTFADAQTALANLETMAASAATAGKTVVVLSVPPNTVVSGGSSALQFRLDWLNEQLELWARSNKNVVFVDAWRDLADPTSAVGAPVTGNFNDGVHPSAAGAYLWGKRIAGAISSLFPVSTPRLRSAIAYDPTNNPGGNRLPNPGFLTGTGGTIANGNGTLVGSYTLQQSAGTWANGTVTASVGSFSAGYGTQMGKYQQLVVNMGALTSFEGVEFYVGAVTGFSTADQIQFECMIDASGVTNMSQLELAIIEDDGVTNFPTIAADGVNQFSAAPNITADSFTGLVLRTPVAAVANGAHNILPVLYITFNSTVSATGTYKIYGCRLNKVN